MRFLKKKKKTETVYLVTNTITGRQSVDSTKLDLVDLITYLKKESIKRDDTMLLYDVRHFGITTFRVEGLAEVPTEEVDDVVAYWRAHYGTVQHGYDGTIY